MSELTLKRTVIAGETVADDWSVIYLGEVVGRIMRRHGNPVGTPQWQWAVTLPVPVLGPAHGTSTSLEDGKAQWQSTWDRVDARTRAEGLNRIADSRRHQEAWERARRA